MRDPPFWPPAPPAHPPFFDLIFIIELTSAAVNIGAPAAGNGPLALTRITNALNALHNNIFPHVVISPFMSVPPLCIGAESIGVIYNSTVLTPLTNSTLVDHNHNAIPARTPLMVDLTVVANNQVLRTVAVHADPTNGDDFTAPVEYCRKLPDVSQIVQPRIPVANNYGTILLGDFNCSPAINVAGIGQPFTTLMNNPPHYETTILNTLTSMKTHITARPENYRQRAYDNIFYYGFVPPVSSLVNLIVMDPRYTGANTNLTVFRNLVKNYWKISDHLPVGISIP